MATDSMMGFLTTVRTSRELSDTFQETSRPILSESFQFDQLTGYPRSPIRTLTVVRRRCLTGKKCASLAASGFLLQRRSRERGNPAGTGAERSPTMDPRLRGNQERKRFPERTPGCGTKPAMSLKRGMTEFR